MLGWLGMMSAVEAEPGAHQARNLVGVLGHVEVDERSGATLDVDGSAVERAGRLLLCVMVTERGRLAARRDLQGPTSIGVRPLHVDERPPHPEDPALRIQSGVAWSRIERNRACVVCGHTTS